MRLFYVQSSAESTRGIVGVLNSPELGFSVGQTDLDSVEWARDLWPDF